MKKFFKEVLLILGLYKVTLEKEEKDVKEVLENLDKRDPRKRTYNSWDKKFEELVPVLYKYDEALEFLNTYGHVLDTYFALLTEEDLNNAAFQLALCKVEYNEYALHYYCCYSNLLHRFLSEWDFCDEVKETLKKSVNEQAVVRFYNAHAGVFKPFRKRL